MARGRITDELSEAWRQAGPRGELRALAGRRPAMARAAGAVVTVAGCVVLAGWALDDRALKSIAPGLVSMKANTAAGFVLAGLALWLAVAPEGRERARLAGLACAAAAALIGLLTLAEYAFSQSLGIDQLLFNDSSRSVGTSPPGRPAPSTATSFVLAGLALSLLAGSRRRLAWPIQLSALAVALIALVAVAGYAYGARGAYAIGPYTQMALHTALAFLVLAVGILSARPQGGPVAAIVSDGAGGVMARHLLPFAIIVPLGLGFIRGEAQQAGLFNTRTGLTLFAMSNVVALTVVVWLSARSLNRTDILRRHAEQELRGRERRFRAVFEGSLDAILIADDARRYVDANRAACDLLGRSREEILELREDDVGPPPRTARIEDTWRAFLEAGREEGEYELRRPDGTVRHVDYRATASFLPGRHLSVLRDVSERKRSEDHIAYLAYHDQLTGLPNRALFSEHLDLALARAGRRDLAAAVLYLDLDRFKLVNDAFGHAAGDELLREIGGRLGEVTRAEDLVARHSGDEFLVLLADLEPDEAEGAARATAAKVHEQLRRPFLVEDQEFFMDASIGVSVFPGDADGAAALLRNADLAMYEGKHAGRGETRLHDRSTAGLGPELSLAISLRTAIECQELELHYQPLVELEGGTVVGAEALIRWQHPELGTIMPDEFIAVAEETGLISSLSDWVVGEACRQAQDWAEQGLRLCVAVNLSFRDLRDPHLVERIDGHLARTGVDPEQLMVEVTETAAASDPARTRQVLVELRERGLHLAIDDFGLGHSSLGRLREVASAHVLKVDRSLVQDLPGDPVASTIIAGIVTIARGLGLSVLAEGVETEAQERLLREQGCRFAQGFRFGRPASAAELAALASARPVAASQRSCALLHDAGDRHARSPSPSM